MNLDNLVGISLEKITPDKDTLQRLHEAAMRSLQDAQLEGISLENSVGRARVCFFRLVRRGVTTRHSHSLQGGNNEAGRAEKGAIGCVALSPIR